MTQSLIRGVSKKKEGTFRKKEWITVFAWTPEDETKKDGVGWLSYFTRPIEEYEKWRDKIGEWAECPPLSRTTKGEIHTRGLKCARAKNIETVLTIFAIVYSDSINGPKKIGIFPVS